MKRNTPQNGDIVPKKKKNKIISLETKILVINEYENGKTMYGISKELELHRSTVSKILENRESILEEYARIKGSKPKKTWLLTETESILMLWCSDQARDNIELTKESVCEQAMELFESLKSQHSEYSDETFDANDYWYIDFKRRCGWYKAAGTQETASKPELNVERIKQAIDNGGYSPQTVFNVCYTSLFWKKLPDACEIARAEQASETGFKKSKDPLTIMVGGNAAGDFKLKPLMVYRTENPKALHGKSKGGLPVIWKSNPRACMLPSLFEDWFGNHFIPSVQNYCTSNGIPFKVMLIIASAPEHLPSTLLDFDHRVKILFLSQDEAYSQPMTDVISILKADYTLRLLEYIKSTVEPAASARLFMVAGLMAWQKFNILHAIRIFMDSWEGLDQEDWISAWEKIFLTSNGADESDESTDKHSRVSQIIENIEQLAHELKLNVSDRDIEALLYSHSTELTPDEFIELRAQSVLEEHETSETLGHTTSNMTVENLSEALTGIKNGLNILQDIDSNESRARDIKKQIYELLKPYEETLSSKIMDN
ncbi:tigger transposable element-derived protein 1 [Helicoverpa armigera]|uniref:tigger transposable element-derived protein 1 n=1 Tax=Helicoverpa armigera TaxID=29058 RepID=UPI003083A320